jgi:hypothetical protein
MTMMTITALLRNTKTTFSVTVSQNMVRYGQQYHSLVAKEMVEAAGDRPVIPINPT